MSRGGDEALPPAGVAGDGWARLDRALGRLRPYRVPITSLIDFAVVCVAWNLTYLFRLGFERWWSARPAYDPAVMLGIGVVYVAALYALQVPRGLWRFSSFTEVKLLAVGTLVAGVAGAAAVMALQLREVPRAVLALHPVFALLGLCTVRVGYRMAYEHARARRHGRGDGDARRAIVMGAGEAARLLLAGLHDQGWDVIALLDDDAAKRNARIGGVAVVGPLADVKRADLAAAATHVVVALPGAAAAERRRAIDLAAATGLPVLTVPSIAELRDGGASVDRIRAIEPHDLLGREPVALDEAPVEALVRGRVALVTGAGGSIGAELCRQLARHGPKRLVLVDASEFNLYAIDQDLGDAFPGVERSAVIGDVRRLESLRAIVATHAPQLVFHAAAYKHVPLVEEGNAWAALQNNTLGTWHAALAAAEAGCGHFVLVSTDKAVNPTSVMGASKRAAEMAVSRLAREWPQTRFMAVRFGNVLGSSGSVIPLFKEQIARGGPVTVTHPEITRYFMTVAEAARLVLQAAAIGETGQVYVLDMGEPVRIVDLAKELIRLAGRRPDEVEIRFTGLRSGEKLYEELLADADDTLPTPVASLRIARLNDDATDLAELLALASREGRPAGDDEVRAALRRAVAEYRPAIPLGVPTAPAVVPTDPAVVTTAPAVATSPPPVILSEAKDLGRSPG